MPWRKVAKGCYENGKYRIERDIGSLDEYDEPDDPEWYVYTLPLPTNYGPPDSLAEYVLLREAKKYCERRG